MKVEDISPTRVKCSPGVLMSIVSNLVENALKYMGDAPVKRVIIAARSGREATHVEVRDTGPGVSRRLSTMIFDPHVRGPESKAPGLGLGLATVRRLAEAHGGSVGVTNNIPTGSVFWIEIPNIPEAPATHSTLGARFASWMRVWRARTPHHR